MFLLFRNLCVYLSLFFCVNFSVLGQGVAVPKSPPRKAPAIKIDRPLPKVSFDNIADKAGLSFQHISGNENNMNYILETIGSGVALFDYNNDGWTDIFLVNGYTFEGFPKGKEPVSHLFRNNKNGTFTDVTTEANLTKSGWGMGVCVGDYDNDGNDDLFVTYYGQNVLYKNSGKGYFTDVTKQSGFVHQSDRWGGGASFLDYDNDGDLDLFVANYLVFDKAKVPAKGSSTFCMWKAVPVVCGPRGLPGGKNLLYRNNGNGVFTDVSEVSGIAIPDGRYPFTPVISDFDNDGYVDIYVACDSTPSILYHNEGNGTFSDIGILSGAALNEDGMEQAGMGISAGDFDNDGLMDLVKTNFSDDTSSLYKNNGKGLFSDVTFQSGLGVNTRFLGWGTGFFDFDNDGWKDIYIVNGHVYPEVEGKTNDRYKQEPILYWNLRNGKFADISAYAGPAFIQRWVSRGAAIADLDNDGSLDIVINNMNDKPALLKNTGEKKPWVIVKLKGGASNRDGIGARVTIYAGNLKLTDEVRSGGSFMSHNDMRLHFGLGESITIDKIEVKWPNGKTQTFLNIKANQILTLAEGN